MGRRVKEKKGLLAICQETPRPPDAAQLTRHRILIFPSSSIQHLQHLQEEAGGGEWPVVGELDGERGANQRGDVV